MVGLVFAGVSAVASQLTAHGRAASSLGMAALGVAFVLRAIGDVRGPESTSVLTWLSPVRLGAGDRAYVDERFWPLAIGFVVAARPRGAWRSGSSAGATSARASWPSGWDRRGRRHASPGWSR